MKYLEGCGTTSRFSLHSPSYVFTNLWWSRNSCPKSCWSQISSL